MRFPTVASVKTGNTLWVDQVYGDNDNCDIGRSDRPCLTIAHALTEWEPGVAIRIRPGTYNEQIQLTSGLILAFESGAIVNYTGSGAVFKTDGGDEGQVKIYGNGRFYKTGSSANQHVFEVGDEDEMEMHWHVDVQYEDMRCLIGRTTTDSMGTIQALTTTFVDAADRASATPVQVGDVGCQLDDMSMWISNGLSEGAWVSLTASTIRMNSGYIKTHGHSLDGVNCHAIRWLSGSADFINERTTATGVGSSALDLGTTNAASENLNQIWMKTLKLSSDPNEIAVRSHNTTSNPVGGNVLYIQTQGVYGSIKCTEDALAFYLNAQLVIPTYDGTYATTQDYLLDINGTSSHYEFNVDDIVGSTASGTMIRVDSNLFHGRFNRMEPVGGNVLEIIGGTATVTYNIANGPFVETGGTLVRHTKESIASQATAEAGTNNTDVMSPLRTRQAMTYYEENVAKPSGNTQFRNTELETWANPYQVLLEDHNYILSDMTNTDIAVIRMPLISTALASGRRFRIKASRSAAHSGDTANMIAVYSHAEEPVYPNFLIGSSEKYSLFSSNAGDYLELCAETQADATVKWRVITFDGYWEDRD